MRRAAFLPWILVAATVVAIVMIFGIARENVRQIQMLRETSSNVAHTLEVQQQLDDVMLAAAEAERNQIAFLLTDVEEYFGEYQLMADRLRAALDRLDMLVADSPAQTRRVEELREATNRMVERLS